MSKLTTYTVQVTFGDCDPAGIVFFPNFSKWMDAASLHFFQQCGVPPWRETLTTRGIIGTPLLEINTRFLRPATYGETLQIHTSIAQWRRKTFIQKHLVQRGETVLCQGMETRAFCIRHADDPQRLEAIEVPEDFKALCS